jgi:hypothetical protein
MVRVAATLHRDAPAKRALLKALIRGPGAKRGKGMQATPSVAGIGVPPPRHSTIAGTPAFGRYVLFH